jgi:broad specificity phosphatase PhoE
VLPDVTDFCRLIFLRHPELDAAHAHVAVGGGAAPLSRRGRERTLSWTKVLREVPIDRVFSADVPQCSEPAKLLALERKLEVETDPRLRDQDMGEWTGKPWSALVAQDRKRVERFFEEFGEGRPPGGESLGEAVDRVLQWWAELAPEGAGKTFAIVTSGALIGGFTAAMLGMRLSRSLSLNLPHGGIAVVEVFGNGVRLQAWNLTGESSG